MPQSTLQGSPNGFEQYIICDNGALQKRFSKFVEATFMAVHHQIQLA
jgi:hypothetical protein